MKALGDPFYQPRYGLGTEQLDGRLLTTAGSFDNRSCSGDTRNSIEISRSAPIDLVLSIDG